MARLGNMPPDSDVRLPVFIAEMRTSRAIGFADPLNRAPLDTLGVRLHLFP